MRKANVARWLSLIIGILFIISGIINFLNPVLTTVSLVQFIAIMLMATGLLRVIRFFSNDLFRVGSFLMAGILDLILGFLMIKNMTVSVLTFTVLVGFWVLGNGIAEIASSIDLKMIGLSRWWLGLISGIIGVVFGFFLITNQGLSTIYISTMFSVFVIILGVNFISTFMALTKLKRKY